MRVHITLVGGQPAPVYHGIVATAPDKVVFICSSSSRRVLGMLIPELSTAYDIFELHPTHPAEILRLAESLAEKYADDEVSVNISSGLKSWSHFFGIVFDRCPNAAVVYMDQNNVLWNYRTMTSSSDFEFDMHALFRLYGNPLKHYRKFTDYTKEEIAFIPEIERARSCSWNDFRTLTSVLDRQAQNKLKMPVGLFENRTTGSYVEWQRTCDSQDIYLCLYQRGLPREFEWSSPHAIDILFNTGWFELKVASILSRWEKAREVLMNCRFPFVAGIDKNEVDIIIGTDTKILFVECKTQIYNTTDIDKFSSVVRTYGGIGSKGLFITQEKMTDIAKQKCNQNGLLSFSLYGEHGNRTAESALYALLDKEILHINTK